MGYTHYFENKRESSLVQWSSFLEAARKIIAAGRAEGIELDVELSSEHVNVNGVGEGSHEDLFIKRDGFGPDAFTFCKTNRKPYDRAVIAVLAAAERELEGFTWSSDGEDEGSMKEGRSLLEKWAPRLAAEKKRVPYGELGSGDRGLDAAFERLAEATDVTGKVRIVKVPLEDLRQVLAQFKILVTDAKRVRS